MRIKSVSNSYSWIISLFFGFFLLRSVIVNQDAVAVSIAACTNMIHKINSDFKKEVIMMKTFCLVVVFLGFLQHKNCSIIVLQSEKKWKLRAFFEESLESKEVEKHHFRHIHFTPMSSLHCKTTSYHTNSHSFSPSFQHKGTDSFTQFHLQSCKYGLNCCRN